MSRTYFHVAPAAARQSILQHGLDDTQGEIKFPRHAYGIPSGNYLWHRREHASMYALNSHEEPADVWRVHEPEHVLVDPEPGPRASYSPHPIPPHKLQLLATWHPDEDAEWGSDDGEWEHHAAKRKRVREEETVSEGIVVSLDDTRRRHEELRKAWTHGRTLGLLRQGMPRLDARVAARRQWAEMIAKIRQKQRPPRLHEAWRPTNPDAVTNYQRSPEEHQEFLTFTAATAGKDARQTARQLGRAWSSLRYQEVARRTRAARRADPTTSPREHFARAVADVKTLSPYEVIGTAKNLQGTLHRAGVTPHTQRAQTFRHLATRLPHPEHADLTDLMQVPGISQKSARFYRLHSRPGEKHAVLDRHILGWMRGHGVATPVNTPNDPRKYEALQQHYFRLADEHTRPGATCAHCAHAGTANPADLDFKIWHERSRVRPRQWRGKSYKADRVWTEALLAGARVGTVATLLLEV